MYIELQSDSGDKDSNGTNPLTEEGKKKCPGFKIWPKALYTFVLKKLKAYKYDLR